MLPSNFTQKTSPLVSQVDDLLLSKDVGRSGEASGIGCHMPRTVRKVLVFVDKDFSLTSCLALLAQLIKIPPEGR